MRFCRALRKGEELSNRFFGLPHLEWRGGRDLTCLTRAASNRYNCGDTRHDDRGSEETLRQPFDKLRVTAQCNACQVRDALQTKRRLSGRLPLIAKHSGQVLISFWERPSTSFVWAEDKLYQILNHRYYAHLLTVITSTLKPESFAVNYPGLWNKILDATKS